MPQDNASVNLRFTRGGEARENTISCSGSGKSQTLDLDWNELTPVPPPVLTAEAWFARPSAERGAPPNLTFSRDEAARLIALSWNDILKTKAGPAAAELSAKKIVMSDKTLKWMENFFWRRPVRGKREPLDHDARRRSGNRGGK